MQNSKNLKKNLDELVKKSDLIVSSPDTIEQLKSQGLPIKSTFETYSEYLDKLFEKKRAVAMDLITKLPRLDESIANTTVQSLYEEIKETFVLGIPGAGITLGVILLELAMKYRLHKERLKSDPNSSWDLIEQLDMTNVISELFKKEILSKKDRKELDEFNSEVRNPYVHYNIKKLIKDMVLSELQSVNVETGEITTQKNVKPENYPPLWFSAKKVLDKKSAEIRVDFCVSWTNKLFSGNTK